MPSKRGQAGKQQPFGAVHGVLNSEETAGQVEPAQLGGFRCELSKGEVEYGELRNLTGEDLKQGIKPETPIIVLLTNPERHGNFIKLKEPPERTGKFAAFMDEAGKAANQAGCLYV
jgi:hypothetical protein